MEANREKLFDYADDAQFRGKTASEIFTGIFRDNIWKNGESVSGEGSSLEQAKEIIKALPEIFKRLGIKSLLDIPCGDFNWMKQADLSGINYTGADIVKEIVSLNIEKHSSDTRKFELINLIEDKLPAHDLVFCRDCLVHFSFADIFSSLENIKKSGALYFMTTTFHQQEENKDIHTGGWRPLNFCRPPFGFPEPVLLLDEKCTEMEGRFSDKSLGLWKVSDL